MKQKLGSAAGKTLYAARKQIVEPVFGMIKSARGSARFCSEAWRRYQPSGN
jgi:hypothetical protein